MQRVRDRKNAVVEDRGERCFMQRVRAEESEIEEGQQEEGGGEEEGGGRLGQEETSKVQAEVDDAGGELCGIRPGRLRGERKKAGQEKAEGECLAAERRNLRQSQREGEGGGAAHQEAQSVGGRQSRGGGLRGPRVDPTRPSRRPKGRRGGGALRRGVGSHHEVARGLRAVQGLPAGSHCEAGGVRSARDGHSDTGGHGHEQGRPHHATRKVVAPGQDFNGGRDVPQVAADRSWQLQGPGGALDLLRQVGKS
mmetsp:Transcript_6927/g.20247  ORF Transcript_6927/g.20247 Transcript_6927/m.20247 type:complete len:252 (+) Transcript_6927:510-1265(+)